MEQRWRGHEGGTKDEPHPDSYRDKGLVGLAGLFTSRGKHRKREYREGHRRGADGLLIVEADENKKGEEDIRKVMPNHFQDDIAGY